ncbi:MAG: amidase [Alphaproteobacteria bacterium]|nr:MAG: amidase [Alphaproteobacteria bacterium]
MTVNETSDVVMMDGVTLSHAIKSKRVSCLEVMSAYLDHVGRFNPGVNAIISMPPYEELLSEARERDVQLGRGEYLGWMHGFPVAVKDNIPVKGLPFTRGSPLFRDFVAPADAIVVERMKGAGAIVIGKTNTPEFALGSQTHNPVFGTTLNPYDPSKTSGGSSGGAAAAVALRMLPVAVGTDHTGSLRNPGAFNNIFTLRPAYGRVPVETADVFNSGMSIPGPLARTVTDLAMLLSVQAGYDPRVPLSIRENPAQFAVPLNGDVRGKRIAWGGDLLSRVMPFEAGVLELCRGALSTFEQLGCVVDEAAPEFPVEQLFANLKVLRAWQLGPMLVDLYNDPTKRTLLSPEAQFEAETYLGLRAADVTIAAGVRSAWYQAVRRFFGTYDHFVLPSAQVFPFDARTPYPTEIAGRTTTDTYYRWMEAMVPVTMAGCPAINVPAGFNDAGLPMGIQIMATNHAERACLEIAYAYDLATRWVERRPPPKLTSVEPAVVE